MRFSRHATNHMRGLGITQQEARALIASEAGWISRDRHGNITIVGAIGVHGVRVVIAGDDPGFVISLHEYRGGTW